MAADKPLIITTGCPSGIGPEVTLRALAQGTAAPCVIVGDRGSLFRAAHATQLDPAWVDALLAYEENGVIDQAVVLEPVTALRASDRRPGRPTERTGRAQLEFIEAGFALAKKTGWPLVTGPVSKEAIAKSGLRRAKNFRGHTEWLEALDGAPYSVMCFASSRLLTSLVTTHVPLARVSRLMSADWVSRATVELADLVLRCREADIRRRPKIAVCSFNPHAGEGQLLGREEAEAILPGVEQAREVLARKATVLGPIGAETAYRKGASGGYDGVVAIYHDQATIPMKLLDFGGSVNVTQGLSIVRTSVDHGTAYDIAGRGVAGGEGMEAATRLARVLGHSRRRVPQGVY